MTKKIISILIPLLVSCSTLNQNAHSSLKEVCIDLLSVRVTIDMPVPIRFYRENYEEGIIYTYIFHDGIVFLHEGALMQFDIDSLFHQILCLQERVLHIGEKSMGNFGKNIFVTVSDFITTM